jgi:hypothetical protein
MESCQEDLRKRCNTAFREIKRPLHLRSMTQAPYLNDKRLQEIPTIIAGADEKTNKAICANEGAAPLGATLSGHTGLRAWH